MGQQTHIAVSWQALSLIVLATVAIVTGAIQLGAVQTHVAINTARVDKIEDNEHKIIEEVTSLKAQREAIIGRLDAIIDRLKVLEIAKH
jgi:cell division protein FtsB